VNELQSLFANGRLEEAGQRLHDLAGRADDYDSFSALLRWRRKLSKAGLKSCFAEKVRVALLGSATTDFLQRPLTLALESAGLASEIHQAPFNTFVREMLVKDSSTTAFAPDVAIVITTPTIVPEWPALDDDAERVGEIAGKVAQHFVDLCHRMHEHAGCDIVLGNFARLSTRPAGAAGTRMPGDPSSFLLEVNRELARRLPAYVHIHDVEALASLYGVLNWHDPRYWHHAKQPVSFECLVPFVRSLAQMISALYGRAGKCVVLDLDNTLWGGIVGDDGAENVSIGEGDAVGEAHAAFQHYLAQLHARGVLLAVCSKNEDEAARSPFRTRPEMVLKENHFAAFVANWEPKSQNIRAIAKRLNIGLDSIVFVDDNPVEREEVRRALPQVRVVELSDDPALYARQLDRTGWLETLSVNAEDRERSRQYRNNSEREALRETATDYDSYLRSLDQRATVGAFDRANLPRITQLTNKTNQFNLTTTRMTSSQIEAVMASAEHLTAYVRLQDRFGDNGLISLCIGRREGPVLWIDQWLMSCRVVSRRVEHLLCNHIVERARAAGVEEIYGLFRPTKKNAPCRGHYAAMGFRKSSEPAEDERWILEVERYEPFDVPIAVEFQEKV
jgi:FkbH-like protein